MRCLVRFLDDWTDFRGSELNSLFQLLGITPLDCQTVRSRDLFLIVDLPSRELARDICSRSILVGAIYELWAEGNCLEDLKMSLSKSMHELEPLLDDSLKWSMNIDAYGKNLSPESKESIRQIFKFIKFRGGISISSPDVDTCILMDFSSNKDVAFELEVSVPCYFGRLICKNGMKEALRKYDLKKRNYIGPTSLDHYLAFIMSNLGHVKKGSLVFDPFVGTGSILVAMAHLGAICMGGDIDARVLRGEMHAGCRAIKEKRGIFENFRIYGLPRPEIIRMDNHLVDRHLHRISVTNLVDGYFDAIVTDPPYGIRAGAKKSGRKELSYVIEEDNRDSHVPSIQNYAVQEVMLDLMHSAARTLVLGGRLVYLIPTSYDFSIHDLPQHPCLEILDFCEQPLSTRHGRHCVVMKKSKKYTSVLEDEFMAYKTRVISGEDDGFGQQMKKLEAALASDPLDEDNNIVKRMSNSVKRRKERKHLHAQSISQS